VKLQSRRGGVSNEQLHSYRAQLANLDAIPAIQFNAAEDWDEHGKLKPQAPVHSPFIRHRLD
jgi:NAD(P)H dehydrogenase (quinone)